MARDLLRQLRGFVSNILFPSRCMACRRVIPGEKYDFCASCIENLPLTEGTRHEFSLRGGAPSGTDLCAAPFFYEGGVKKAITRMKFSGRACHAPALARYMFGAFRRAAAALPERDFFPDLITYVPVSEKRRKQRGFDQGRLLAEELSDIFGVPFADLLVKTADNPPQSGLDATARKGNVLGMYALSENAPSLRGMKLLLADDVLTTGATAGEAAKILRLLEPELIVSLFVAKTEPGGKKRKNG